MFSKKPSDECNSTFENFISQYKSDQTKEFLKFLYSHLLHTNHVEDYFYCVIDEDVAIKHLNYKTKHNFIKILKSSFQFGQDYCIRCERFLISFHTFLKILLTRRNSIANRNMYYKFEELFKNYFTHSKKQIFYFYDSFRDSSSRYGPDSLLDMKLLDTLRKNEALILENIPSKYPYVYIGYQKNLNFIKFGQSSQIHKRVNEHKQTSSFFYLIKVFPTHFHVRLENAIKKGVHDKKSPYYKKQTTCGTKIEILDISSGIRVEDIIKYIEGLLKNIENSVTLKEELLKTQDELVELQKRYDILESCTKSFHVLIKTWAQKLMSLYYPKQE